MVECLYPTSFDKYMLLKLSASKVKPVISTILMNRDLHNANLAAILSVSVRLIENRLTEIL